MNVVGDGSLQREKVSSPILLDFMRSVDGDAVKVLDVSEPTYSSLISVSSSVLVRLYSRNQLLWFGNPCSRSSSLENRFSEGVLGSNPGFSALFCFYLKQDAPAPTLCLH